MRPKGTLVFFCGKMGAGKSTLSMRMAEEMNAVRISEDDWLTALYPGEIDDFNDYRRYSARMKPLLAAHVRSILNAGTSVVMDFPGNTPAQRAWFREIFDADRIPHRLIHLDIDDDVCLQRLGIRAQQEPARAKFDTEEMFRHVSSFFQPPSDQEGFHVQVVKQERE